MVGRLTCGSTAIVVLCACGPGTGGPVTSTPLAPTPPTAAPPPGPPPASITDEVTGDYTLTLDLGSGCAILPESERTRTYTATITSPREANYVVTLTSGNFLSGVICTAYAAGLGCHQFQGSRDGARVRFDLANNNDDAHGGHIVERLPSGTWVEIIGNAAGQVEGSTIDAAGSITVWYCRTSQAYPFPCSDFAGCSSTDMKLRFTRR